jgi:hypothetical protein
MLLANYAYALCNKPPGVMPEPLYHPRLLAALRTVFLQLLVFNEKKVNFTL